MANTKITELTAVTALAGTDVFPVVDVSANSTNKVSVEDLLRNAPDGSAGAPSIANAGDQDTGIFFPADNSVGVSTDGTQRFVIDSSGRLLVGTTTNVIWNQTSEDGVVIQQSGATQIVRSNDVPLLVTRNTNTGQIVKFSQAGTERGAILYDGVFGIGSVSDLSFGTGGSERMRIDSNGRLGVGTTSPLTKIDSLVNTFNDDSTKIAASFRNNQTSGVYAVWQNTTTGTAFSDGLHIGLTNISDGLVALKENKSLKFEVNGSERLRIDSLGRVGIGTTAPGYELDVTGSIKASSQGRFGNGSASTPSYAFDSDHDTGMYRATTNALGFATSGSERLRIDSSGNVGIGTSSPSALFHVKGSGTILSKIESSTATSGIDIADDTAYTRITSTGGLFKIDANDSGSAATSSIQFAQAGTTKVIIDNSGNVGIGTSSPSTSFHVNGSGDQYITVTSSNTQKTGIQFGSTSDPDAGGIRYATGDNSFRIRTNNAEAVRIDSSGNVGIGTSSPADKLHVVGNGRFNDGTNGAIQLGSSSNNRIAGGSSYGGVRYYTNGSHAWYDSSSELMKLDSSGRVGIGTSGPTAKLTIAGGTANNYTDGILLSKSGGNAYGIYPSTNNLEFRSVTGSNHIATFDYNGKVGIGTTSPSQALDVVTSTGNAYIRAARNSQSSGQVALNLAGGTSGVDWILYQPTSSNDFRIFGNSSDRLTVTSAGNVGIGTTSPSQLLDISSSGNAVTRINSGSANTTGVIFSRGGTEVARVSSAATDVLTFSTGSSASERMRIDSSGRLLVGTTTNVIWNQTSEDGVVIEQSGATQIVRNGDVPLLVTRNTSTGQIAKFSQAGTERGSIFYDGDFGIASASDLTFDTSGSERMRIDSSGRLLVGSSSNSMGCNVESATTGGNNFAAGRFAASTGGPDIVLRKSRNATVGSHTIVQDGDDLGNIFWGGSNGSAFKNAARITAQVDGTPGTGDDMPGRLTFYTSADGSSSPTERMRIGSEGQFSLYSEGALTRTSIVNSGTSALSAAFDIRNNATSTTTGTQVFAVRENGDIYTSGNTTVQSLSSERRLKENIEVIDPAAAWTTIKNTPYYSYNYIGQEGPRYGPIVDEVPADMVRDTDLSDNQGPIRTFDNGMLHARLYSALQQAIAKIETLEAKVAALEAQ